MDPQPIRRGSILRAIIFPIVFDPIRCPSVLVGRDVSKYISWLLRRFDTTLHARVGGHGNRVIIDGKNRASSLEPTYTGMGFTQHDVKLKVFAYSSSPQSLNLSPPACDAGRVLRRRRMLACRVHRAAGLPDSLHQQHLF